MENLPVLAIHGMWEDEKCWGDWPATFAREGLPIILMKYKLKDRADVHFQTYAGEIREKVKETGECILMGHSLGGLLAQSVANDLPDLVKKVVVVNSAAPFGIWPISKGAWWRMMDVHYIPALLFGKPFRIKTNHAKALMLNGVVNVSPEFVFPNEESGKVLREVIRGQWVNPVKCPSLVVASRKDRMTPPRIQRAIARKHKSDTVEVDGCHVPMLQESARDTARMICNWLYRN